MNQMVKLTWLRIALMSAALFLSIALPSVAAYVSLSNRVSVNETHIQVLTRLESKIDLITVKVHQIEIAVRRLEVKVEQLEKQLEF